jgi:hypothetical protein
MSTHRVEELGEGDDRVLGLRDEPVTQVAHLVLSRADRRERVQRERHGDRLIEQVDLAHISDGADGIVEQLRDNDKGAPLLAKASGKISLGDVVLAVNDVPLPRVSDAAHRTPAEMLEAVAKQFRSAPRPVRVLFKKGDAGAA